MSFWATLSGLADTHRGIKALRAALARGESIRASVEAYAGATEAAWDDALVDAVANWVSQLVTQLQRVAVLLLRANVRASAGARWLSIQAPLWRSKSDTAATAVTGWASALARLNEQSRD